jgi:hypothetical protein
VLVGRARNRLRRCEHVIDRYAAADAAARRAKR